MRLGFGSSIRPPEPLVLTLVSGIPFLKAEYLTLGYTTYDVMCIGAAGGLAGAVGSITPGYGNKIVHGGGGGGGGSHLLRGLTLAGLPTSVPIVVGVAGTVGNSTTIPANGGTATAGGDGGYSSFNDTTCRASGGKGGLAPAISASPYTTGTVGAGGAGGIGNSIVAGGGAAAETEGNWLAGIGKGGGGGKGGQSFWTGTVTNNIASPVSGKRGAYALDDPDEVSATAYSIAGWAAGQQLSNVKPTGGGGAMSNPITARALAYGCATGANSARTAHGGVFIRLYVPES